MIPLWLTFCKFLLIYMLTCQRLSMSFCRDPLGPFLKSCVTCILVYWLTWITWIYLSCLLLSADETVWTCTGDGMLSSKAAFVFSNHVGQHVSWGKSVRLFGNPSSLPQKKIWFGGFCTVRSPHVSIWGLMVALWFLDVVFVVWRMKPLFIFFSNVLLLSEFGIGYHLLLYHRFYLNSCQDLLQQVN